MKKCSFCSKQFPDTILKQMVQILNHKAYLQNICPSCQAIVSNNPSYYYLVEESNK